MINYQPYYDWWGAESARAVEMLYAAQKLLAQMSLNFITFPDFYSSKDCCNF